MFRSVIADGSIVAAPRTDLLAICSVSEFQDPQKVQRPDHLACASPQSLQTNCVTVLGIHQAYRTKPEQSSIKVMLIDLLFSPSDNNQAIKFGRIVNTKTILKDQRGIAPVLELFLVIAVIGVLGFAGWRVYQARQDKPAATTTETKADPYAGWKTYSSTKAKFSFKYPSAWGFKEIPVNQGCSVCVEELGFGDDLAIVVVQSISQVNGRDEKVDTIERYKEVSIDSQLAQGTYADFEYVTIGGKKAASYKIISGIPPLPTRVYEVVANGNYYTFNLYTNQLSGDLDLFFKSFEF